MCTYLSKRGSTYYFRRVIPAELRPAFAGRSEFMRSLGTKDRAEAKRLIPTQTEKTDRLMAEALRNPTTARAVDPERPAQPDAEFAHGTDPWSIDQAEAAAETAREDAEKAERREARSRSPEAREVRRKFTANTADLAPGEAYWRDAWREERDSAASHSEKATIARALLAEARVPCVSVVGVTSAIALGDSGKMLDTDILDLWAAERKPVKKGKDTHRAVAEWFYERTGRKPVDQITRKDVQLFKSKLIEEGQTAANTKMKLSRLRTLLQWAFDNDHAALNAAEGVTIKDTEAAKNKRKEFDLASLNSIFASPVYADGARPAGGKGEAAYWLPLLALYTGARLEELGQLRPGDVQEIAYPDADGAERKAWTIRIAEDAAGGLTIKNAASERVVPVHPELARLGFLQFVSDASEASQPRLFPKLRPNTYGRLSAKWGEWFGPYLRTVCGVTDKRMVFHSFRHTFKHYARHGGLIEGVQRQIMGHTPGDVAGDYGSGYTLHQVVEGMKLYRVPGLATLPAPTHSG